MEINREEVKEEVLKIGKWTRFAFMFLYAFVLNFVISVSIGLAFIQFLFFLFTSKINDSLADFNNHLFLFVSDTLKFLLFETDDKPFPFKKSSQATSSDTSEIVDIEADEVEEEPESETDAEEALEEGKPEESSKS
ncbi:DUF4389 domain-containing protein [Gammaproteobacteria bacterium]|mgnify:CR=1 FL=1|jgi:hypothetical protein|nr:DUF4389 domain-containing protein [Gammaproteobacteria bacterium]MDC0536333.1 DUF4389 domain-containing protein [Gammaproteobacteria bacterium]MDC1149448.1 DUF4389 domain-containing protein [Gammaproteobacteria bacterium]